MTALAPWQQRTLEVMLAALADGRLGHALLLTGPERIGKRALAECLAQRLLCTAPGAGGAACGQCRGCRLYAAGSHPDLRRIGLETSEKTGNLRSEIVVEQMRELGQWFALTPQRGGVQIALIDPAERMNASAANALLKTLEEPLPGRYLLLVCAQPERLPATVRSRCQRQPVKPPERTEALRWLSAQYADPATAAAALEAARGNPGLARHWLETGAMAEREKVLGELHALAAGRAGAVQVAERWLADEALPLRLDFAAESVRDRLRAGLTSRGDVTKLSAWFGAVNQLRRLTATSVRADLALAGLLHQWRMVWAKRGQSAPGSMR